jgi:DNA repair ATPase RecN
MASPSRGIDVLPTEPNGKGPKTSTQVLNTLQSMLEKVKAQKRAAMAQPTTTLSDLNVPNIDATVPSLPVAQSEDDADNGRLSNVVSDVMGAVDCVNTLMERYEATPAQLEATLVTLDAMQVNFQQQLDAIKVHVQKQLDGALEWKQQMNDASRRLLASIESIQDLEGSSSSTKKRRLQ